MKKLKERITENGIDYILVGDYYIPDLQLPEESRPIGIWGRMHKAYLELYHPARYADLILSGQLWTYLADLNEQAQNHKYAWKYSGVLASQYFCQSQGADFP